MTRGANGALLLLLSALVAGCPPAKTIPAAPAAALSTDSVHRVSIGSGAITTIVLHGGPGYRHDYLRPEWDRLASLGRVVYYDQRGCGRSTRVGPHAWSRHVADLHALTREVGDGPVVLAGTGWGAVLALLYAYHHPERVSALVLADPAELVSADDWARLDRMRRGAISLEETEALDERQAELAALASGPLASPLVTDSAINAASATLDPRLAARLGESCPGAAAAVLHSLRAAPPVDSLSRVTAPTLVVRGGLVATPFDRPAMYARVLPRAESVTLDGAGADSWLDRPEEFFAAVEHFLGGVGR